MSIPKYKSCREIISKTVRQLDLSGEDIPWEDMVEYINDALRHIGSYFQFTQKEGVVSIVDNKGKLPCDYHEMIRILSSVNSPLNTDEALTAQDTKNILKYNLRIEELEGFLLTEVNATKILAYQNEIKNLKADEVEFLKTIKTYTTPSSTSYGLRDSRLLNYNSNLINPDNNCSNQDYRIDLDTITVGFKTGSLVIQYQAIPLDEEGFPLVPDTPMYDDALFWRIASMMALQGKLKNKDLSFDYCDQKWKRYCRGAYSDSMMPDLDGMERLKNQFYQLKPNLHQYDNLFTSLGQRQVLNRSPFGRY